MKAALLLVAASFFYCSTTTTKVYICHSGTSYAYHNKLCQGLRNCTRKIDTVTLQQAFESGHKKPCGYCYK